MKKIGLPLAFSSWAPASAQSRLDSAAKLVSFRDDDWISRILRFALDDNQ